VVDHQNGATEAKVAQTWSTLRTSPSRSGPVGITKRRERSEGCANLVDFADRVEEAWPGRHRGAEARRSGWRRGFAHEPSHAPIVEGLPIKLSSRAGGDRAKSARERPADRSCTQTPGSAHKVVGRANFVGKAWRRRNSCRSASRCLPLFQRSNLFQVPLMPPERRKGTVISPEDNPLLEMAVHVHGRSTQASGPGDDARRSSAPTCEGPGEVPTAGRGRSGAQKLAARRRQAPISGRAVAGPGRTSPFGDDLPRETRSPTRSIGGTPSSRKC
jgi:hypothetical protein